MNAFPSPSRVGFLSGGRKFFFSFGPLEEGEGGKIVFFPLSPFVSHSFQGLRRKKKDERFALSSQCFLSSPSPRKGERERVTTSNNAPGLSNGGEKKKP